MPIFPRKPQYPNPKTSKDTDSLSSYVTQSAGMSLTRHPTPMTNIDIDYIEELALCEPSILRRALDDKIHLVDVLIKTHIDAWITKHLDRNEDPATTSITPSKGQRHNESSIHRLRARKSLILSMIERVEIVRRQADEERAGNGLPVEQDPLLLHHQSAAAREDRLASKNPFRESAHNIGRRVS